MFLPFNLNSNICRNKFSIRTSDEQMGVKGLRRVYNTSGHKYE